MIMENLELIAVFAVIVAIGALLHKVGVRQKPDEDFELSINRPSDPNYWE